MTGPRPCPTCGRPIGPQVPGGLHQAQWLNPDEVAAVLRVSRMTVYRLCHDGSLGARRFGRSFRIPRQALDAYLNRSQVRSAVVE